MRILGTVIVSAALITATPAFAVGLGDLAKVVLNGNSVLKKGKEVCGTALGLTQDDDLALALARSAAERALPISEFTKLDTAASASADSASKSAAFCDTTKKEKTGIISKVKNAGKSILKKRLLGG